MRRPSAARFYTSDQPAFIHLPSLWLGLGAAELWLIHSLAAPGGLLALRDLSPPLSRRSCHFHGHEVSPRFMWVPETPNSTHFSLAETLFLSASQTFCGSPRPPADQMLGSLCVSAGSSEYSLSRLQLSHLLPCKSNLYQTSLHPASAFPALLSLTELVSCNYWTGNYSHQ